MISASYHNVQNMLNMVYADFDYVFRMEDKKYFRVGVQGMYQESNGQSLMRGVNGSAGPSFNTNYGGVYVEARPVAGVESDVATVESLIRSKDVPVYPFSPKGEESSNMSDAAYIEMVKKGIASCHRGDVFQIVLSRIFI